MTQFNRRQILKAGAASAFAFNFFPSRVFGANARMAVAGIGAGGKGRADIAGSAAAGADIVASAMWILGVARIHLKNIPRPSASPTSA